MLCKYDIREEQCKVSGWVHHCPTLSPRSEKNYSFCKLSNAQLYTGSLHWDYNDLTHRTRCTGNIK